MFVQPSNNAILDKSIQFALSIIDFVENQLKPAHKYELANQLFRSGTAIGANVSEAQNAESRADFIHKLKIAAKEADETAYWLYLCQNSIHYPNPNDLQTNLLPIQKLLTSIITTSKKTIS
jgi:four helix bundle protein